MNIATTVTGNWRGLRFFNRYRLCFAAAALAASLVPLSALEHWPLPVTAFQRALVLAHMAGVLLGMALARHRQGSVDLHLTAQMMLDIVVVTALMAGAGGIVSGLGVLLLLSLVAGSLVGEGRLVLLYAAMATFALLGLQLERVLTRGVDLSTLFPAGLTALAFFATALLARLLGQRIRQQEAIARQHAEALLAEESINQRVIERMQDGVLVLDSAGWIKRCNPVARDLLPGVDTGLSVLYAAPELAQAVGWPPRSAHSRMATCRTAAGKVLQVRIEPSDNLADHWLLFLEDMGRVEAQVQQLKLASLGRLTAGVAHEIRNPLSAIGHAGELLQEEHRADIRERLLRIIADNVARLNGIVQQVLEVGRDGKARVSPVPLARFCNEFVEHFILAERLPADHVVSRIPEDLVIMFDLAHLQRVLWNLCANAVRHGRRQAGSVVLAASEGGTEVLLTVSDDGPGVPDAERDKIFEPFFTTQAHGTGLGLFLARELCEANGARLTLASGGEGARFCISAAKGEQSNDD